MKIYEKLTFLTGSRDILEGLCERSEPVQAFADETLDFLECWAEKIRELPADQKDGQTAAFGFWIRRASLLEMKSRYEGTDRKAGCGLSLHFVPSNVPALFAYSLAAALLAGNCVAMRLSSKEGSVKTALIDALNQALEEKPEWKQRITLFRYEHDREITDALSKACRVRVIWGGDSSVAEIQRSPIRPAARDITFPNRRSMAVINARAVLGAEDLNQILRAFHNDTYLSDQNACSSPSFICWIGEKEAAEKASGMFFAGLSKFLKGRWEVQPQTAVSKLEQAMYLAALGTADEIITAGNDIVRVRVTDPDPTLWDQMIPGGFFAEYMPGTAPDRKVAGMLTPVCQTISVFGEDPDEVRTFTMKETPGRNFQIVHMGHTLDFDLNWDGHDLIREMSRDLPEEITVERAGCRLYVRKQGNGLVLLLIHGVACDSDFFSDSADLLAEKFTCLTYDRRGYTRSTYPGGATEGPQDASLEEQVLDAKEILTRFLKDGEKAIVAGCSAGGIVAIELAHRFPELIEKLFLYEAAFAVSPGALESMEDWKEQLREAAQKNHIARSMLLFMGAIGPKDEKAADKSPKEIAANLSNLERFLKLEMEDMLGFSKRNEGLFLTVPCICGVGTFDKETMFYRMMSETAKKWGCECTQLEGSHNLAEDRPDTFAAWIEENA